MQRTRINYLLRDPFTKAIMEIIGFTGQAQSGRAAADYICRLAFKHGSTP